MQYYSNQRLTGRASQTTAASYQKVPTTESYSSSEQQQTSSSSSNHLFGGSTSSTSSSIPFSSSSRIRPSQEDIKQRMGFQHRSDADQRAALTSGFNRRPPAGATSSFNTSIGKASEADRHGAQMAADLEAQNDEMLNEMHVKVLGLKEIALGMKEQVQESNSLLDKMGTAMTSAGSLLGNTMTRLQALTSFRTGRHIWYMMLFFVAVIFIMYLLFGKNR